MQDENRSGRTYEADPQRVLRVKIPADLRRKLKIYQLKGNVTADEAVTEILTTWFASNPV
jgi:hypothetical protein